ncbi:hypothetical protein HanIR_Chr17g0865971 [Helianthus annuus]|nr:hypothetical protein HanIR_Chr17g0865971 [Helianthus annuus]
MVFSIFLKAKFCQVAVTVTNVYYSRVRHFTNCLRNIKTQEALLFLSLSTTYFFINIFRLITYMINLLFFCVVSTGCGNRSWGTMTIVLHLKVPSFITNVP